MPKDINLLPQMMEQEIKRSAYKRYGSLLSIGLLVVVGVVVVGLFLWLFLLNNSINGVNQDIANREQAIKDSAEKELQVRALASKVKLIKPLVDTPYNYSDVLTKIQSLAQSSPSVEVSNLTVEGNQLTFTARAPGSQPIDDFFTSLLDKEQGGKNFTKVVLTSLNKSENLNEYRFGLEMIFIPDPKGATSGSTN